jgi:DNA-binding Xre family transcriptional regulator
MHELSMPIRSRVKVLLAERNLDRTRAGEDPISVRQISRETGITHSALVRLVNNQSERVDFETIDKLMRFFGTSDIRDILEYIPEK